MDDLELENLLLQWRATSNILERTIQRGLQKTDPKEQQDLAERTVDVLEVLHELENKIRAHLQVGEDFDIGSIAPSNFSECEWGGDEQKAAARKSARQNVLIRGAMSHITKH